MNPDNIDAALTVAALDMRKIDLRSISRCRFINYWAKFSLANRQMLLDRCASDAHRVKVLKRLEEYQAIVVASTLVGDED